jgi:hypothetical protein
MSIFVFIGIALIFYALKARQNLQTSQKWARTPAEILKLDYLEDLDDDGHGVRSVNILYQYNVQGKNYQNSKISFGYIGTDAPEYHQRIYNILKTKNIINIYYDPRNPQNSTISRSLGIGPSIMIPMGLIFIVVGCGMMIAYYISDISNLDASIRESITNIGVPIGMLFIILNFVYAWLKITSDKVDKLTQDIRNC